jgi:hypothetical protein
MKSSKVTVRPDKSFVKTTLITASVQVVQYQVVGVCEIPVTVLLEQTHCMRFDGELTLFA